MARHRTSRPRRLSPRSTHDNRRAALPAPAPDGLDGLLYILRDNLRRTDAMVSTAERQIEENWHDNDDDEENDVEEEFNTVLRHRMRIEYLVEAGKLAVRAALYTVQQIDAEIASKRRA